MDKAASMKLPLVLPLPASVLESQRKIKQPHNSALSVFNILKAPEMQANQSVRLKFHTKLQVSSHLPD
jgi:hypothetical protein